MVIFICQSFKNSTMTKACEAAKHVDSPCVQVCTCMHYKRNTGARRLVLLLLLLAVLLSQCYR